MNERIEKNKLSEAEKKKLLGKFENKTKKNISFQDKKEMYQKERDRNYKDGDRN